MKTDDAHQIPGGYILQPRAWDESDAAHFPPVLREVWFWLLRNVSHKDHKSCKRGEGFFTLKDMQDGLSWSVGYRRETYSKPQLTKSLRRLREEHMIETTKATRGIRVTINNYERYQNPENYESNNEGNAKATRRQREGHTIDKNVKNVKNVKKKRERGQFKPPEQQEVTSYFAELEAKDGESTRFYDYYTANGWRVGRNKMKDWKAAARNWVARDQQQRPNKNDNGDNQTGNEAGVNNFGARNLERLEGLFTRTQAS